MVSKKVRKIRVCFSWSSMCMGVFPEEDAHAYLLKVQGNWKTTDAPIVSMIRRKQVNCTQRQASGTSHFC